MYAFEIKIMRRAKEHGRNKERERLGRREIMKHGTPLLMLSFFGYSTRHLASDRKNNQTFRS